MIENWGNFFYTMFEYEIYNDFSKIELEGRRSVFPELFENLSINFSVPVLVKYYTEGNYGTGMRFLDPNKKIKILCDVPDDDLLNISAINFQALGVSQNVFSVFNKKNPLEVGGCAAAKERRQRIEKSNEWNSEEKIEFKKEKNNVIDGDW